MKTHLTDHDRLPGRSERLWELHSFLSKPVPQGRMSMRYHQDTDLEVISARTYNRDLDGSGLPRPRGVALFEDEIRESLAVRAGATVMNFGKLSGEQSIPSIDPSLAAGWGSSPSSVEPETLLNLAEPRRVWCMITVSSQLAIQGGLAGTAYVYRQLHSGLALAIDKAVFNGTGASGQPFGLFNDSAVASTDVAAPFDLGAFAGQLFDAEQAINETHSGSPNAIFTSPSILRELREGQPADKWQIAAPLAPVASSPDIAGTRAVIGNFRNLAIVHWGEVEILVNPYSRDTEGMIRLIASMNADVLAVRPESFQKLIPA